MRTTENLTSASAFADSKPHYPLLDAMRGVAALVVIWYHIFEGFATSAMDQRINHGYLAVDFFFILSGFVLGYAYDDRWSKMTLGQFFKRRLWHIDGRTNELLLDAFACRYDLDAGSNSAHLILPAAAR